MTAEKALAEANRLIGNSFRRQPDNWAIQVNTQTRYMMPALTALADMKPCRVLDVGCGRGTFAKAAALLGHEVTGIDWFTDLPTVDGVRWLKWDIERLKRLPLAEGRQPYDVAVFHEVLEHVNWYPVGVLQTIYDALRPGGVLYGSTPNKLTWPEPALTDGYVSGLEYRANSGPRQDAHIRLYHPGEISLVCQRAGFAPPATDTDTTGYHTRWRTTKQTWAWVTGPPRSGTTLMCLLLNLHPGCRMEGETHFASHLLQVFRGDGLRHNWHHHILWDGGEHQRLMSLPRLRETGPDRTAIDCARASAWSLRDLAGSPAVYGDKSPLYCMEWPSVVEVFPDSKWVVMDRELGACAASLQKQSWGETDFAAATATVKRYKASAEAVPGIRVSLGALETDHREVISGVLVYLGLDEETYPWDEAALRFEPGAAKIN